MVILKDPKTGKYYIAPSPPSFYKAYPSKKTLKKYGIVKTGGVVTVTEPTTITKVTEPTTITKVTEPTTITKVTEPILRRSVKEPSMLSIPQVGTGTFTRAVNIGGGRMQDYLFRYSGGRITNRTALGRSFIQTKRFKEKEKERLVITTKAIEKQEAKKLNLKAKLRSTIDVISGGYLTERSLDKKQETINQDVESFNKKFGGRELTESQFKEANRISKTLETREKDLVKERDNLAESLRSKVGGALFKTLEGRRLTSTERSKLIKSNKPLVEKQESKLERVTKQISQESKKKGFVSKLMLKKLKNEKSGIQEEIKRLETGRPSRFYAGEFPIIPAVSIPSGVTNIVFIGKQRKAKGGKIITDIVFRTDKGRLGVAKGVTVAKKGKTGASVVLGRSGKMAFKFPSRKKKIIDLHSFIGRERAVTIPAKITLQKKIDLLHKAKKTGITATIKQNLNILQQKGIGQVATVKGKRFMRGGKAVKGISRDNFASISAIFTKKELSQIIGKTITEMGAKTRFIGIIKGTSKTRPGIIFDINQKTQYSKALTKIVSATASALSKAEKTGRLPRATSLIVASRLALAKARAKPKPTKVTLKKPKPKPVTKPTPIIKPKAKPKVKRITGKVVRIIGAKPKAKPKPVTKLKPITKLKKKRVTKVKVKPRVKRKVVTWQRARPKTIQRQKQLMKTLTKQEQKLFMKTLTKNRQKLLMRSLAKQKVKLLRKVPRAKAPGIRVPRIPLVKKPKRKKKPIRKPIRKPKRKQAYNVYARPRKKKTAKRRPKLIKVNKVPLSKTRAKDLRNLIVDTSLSRTARIKKTKGKPRKSKLKIPRGYARKTSKKFRRHKIVKGKRKILPKGTVIEKRKYLLDRRREKRQITLRKRILQITKQKRKIIRKTKKTIQRPARVTRVKRTRSPTRKAVKRTTRKIKRPARVTKTRRQTKKSRPTRKTTRKPTRKTPTKRRKR